jgi:hypothetical protein
MHPPVRQCCEFYAFFSTGISETFPRRFLLQAGSNTTMITRYHYHHFPTLSLETFPRSIYAHTLTYSPYYKNLYPYVVPRLTDETAINSVWQGNPVFFAICR